jgi:hypothetical protein
MFEKWTGRGIKSDGLVVAIFARSTDRFTCAVRNLRLGYGAQGRCSTARCSRTWRMRRTSAGVSL